MTKLIWISMTAALMLLSLTYIFFACRRGLSGFRLSPFRLRLCSLLGTGILASPLLLSGKPGRLWMLVLLHLSACLLLTQLADFVIRKRFPSAPVWSWLYRFSVLPVVLTAGMLTYGYFNINTIVRTEYTVSTEKPVPPGGYTVALLSDIHFGNAATLPLMEQVMDRIRREQPDLILLGGDIVDENTAKADMEALFPVLGSVPAPLGTFYVYGNHDLQRYTSSPTFTEDELNRTIAKSHITILADEAKKLDDTLLLAGRRDRTMGQMPAGELLSRARQEDYLLLLDHQPYHFKEKELAGADLTLSGHTHAGQIFPAGLFTAGDLNYGKERLGKMTAIVTSGASGWGFLIRTANHSEYVIIRIIPQSHS